MPHLPCLDLNDSSDVADGSTYPADVGTYERHGEASYNLPPAVSSTHNHMRSVQQLETERLTKRQQLDRNTARQQEILSGRRPLVGPHDL
jgi:hypothetical protein